MSKTPVTTPVSFENRRVSEDFKSCCDVEVKPTENEVAEQVEMPKENGTKAHNCLQMEKKNMTSNFCGSTHEITSEVMTETTLSACTMCFHCQKNKTDTEDHLYDSSLTSIDIDNNVNPPSKRKELPTVRSFVVCLSLVQLFQVMGSGYTKSAVTSIEQRYAVSSSEMGILQSCFHIGNLSVILFVSYFGSKWHRPRSIAIGAILMGVSSVISVSPQFFGSRYNPFTARVAGNINRTLSASNAFPNQCTDPMLCTLQESTIAGTDDSLKQMRSGSYNNGKENDDAWLFFLIAVGSVVKGMGHSPVHPLGISFIDDHATPQNSAIYVGIITTLTLFGPVMGFLLGSITTQLWVDFGWCNPPKNMTEKDSGWIGAWWLGYLVTGGMLILASLLLFRFPRKIQKEKETEDTEENSGCARYLQGCCASPSMMNHNDNDDDDLEKEIFNPNTEFGGVHANEYTENEMDVITVNSGQSPNKFSFETFKTSNHEDEESNINETLQINDLNKTNAVSCCTLHVSKNCNDVEDKK